MYVACVPAMLTTADSRVVYTGKSTLYERYSRHEWSFLPNARSFETRKKKQQK